jgi:hypothetical protein
MKDPTRKASQRPLVPKELTSEDIGKWTIGQLVSKMKPSNLYACIGVIVVLVVGAFKSGENFAGKPSTAESPTVDFTTAYTTASLEKCGNAARDELASAQPTKLLPLLQESGVTSNFGVFGSLTAWVSCVDAGGQTVIYTGAAGADSAEAQVLRSKLAEAVSFRLQKLQ